MDVGATLTESGSFVGLPLAIAMGRAASFIRLAITVAASVKQKKSRRVLILGYSLRVRKFADRVSGKGPCGHEAVTARHTAYKALPYDSKKQC